MLVIKIRRCMCMTSSMFAFQKCNMWGSLNYGHRCHPTEQCHPMEQFHPLHNSVDHRTMSSYARKAGQWSVTEGFGNIISLTLWLCLYLEGWLYVIKTLGSVKSRRYILYDKKLRHINLQIQKDTIHQTDYQTWGFEVLWSSGSASNTINRVWPMELWISISVGWSD